MMPPLPQDQPATFRTTVHGTVFADRAARVSALAEGEELLLIPDPPLEEDPAVWVHVRAGDLVGHLPPEVNQWLAPWLLRGGDAKAHVARLHGPEAPSYKRLVIEIVCSPVPRARTAPHFRPANDGDPSASPSS